MQLRYDLFDLRRVQLWVGGACRGVIAPDVLREHAAAAVRDDPPPPEPRATGTSLLAVLTQQYEAELRREAEGIPFRRIAPPVGPQLAALVARLEVRLGRALRPAEQRQLAAVWSRRGPLPADTAADRLRPHLARIGRATAPADILELLWRDEPCSPDASA